MYAEEDTWSQKYQVKLDHEVQTVSPMIKYLVRTADAWKCLMSKYSENP